MRYAEIFSKLTYEIGILIFFKKDGTIRIMLATRNLKIIELEYGFQGAALGGHDNKCNINNGNLSVFDVIIGEARSFNINRLVDIQYCGIPSSKEELGEIILKYQDFKRNYESTQNMELTMDMLDLEEKRQW